MWFITGLMPVVLVILKNIRQAMNADSRLFIRGLLKFTSVLISN